MIYKILFCIYHIFCCFPAKKLPRDVNERGVFACNELDLEEVNVYGFDYDYTLALYKPSMDFLLYNLGRDNLIHKYKVHFLTSKFFFSIHV